MDLNSYDNNSLGFETNNVQIYLTYFLIVPTHCAGTECLKCSERAVSEPFNS